MADAPEPGSEEPSRKRDPKQLIGLIVTIAVLVIGVGLIGHGIQSHDTPSSDTETATRDVVITVTSSTGTGAATVTYTTLSGQQQENAALPWTRDVGAVGNISVVAQAGQYTTGVSCAITVNGTQVSSNTSTGQYAVVSCAG